MNLVELADIEAIKHLKARYFWCVDTKNYDELRSLFTDDARFDTPVVQYDDVDEWVRAVSERHAGVTTVHHGHLPDITLESPVSARGIWPMFDFNEWPPGKHPPEDPLVRGYRGYGHYIEEYRKDADGEWRISFLKLTRIRLDMIPADSDPSPS